MNERDRAVGRDDGWIVWACNVNNVG